MTIFHPFEHKPTSKVIKWQSAFNKAMKHIARKTVHWQSSSQIRARNTRGRWRNSTNKRLTGSLAVSALYSGYSLDWCNYFLGFCRKQQGIFSQTSTGSMTNTIPNRTVRQANLISMDSTWKKQSPELTRQSPIQNGRAGLNFDSLLVGGWFHSIFHSTKPQFLFLTTGKGLHSQGGVAKIKPAIEELMQKWAKFSMEENMLSFYFSGTTSKPTSTPRMQASWLYI